MPQQWDPYAVLNIAKSRTMCYGWAPSQNRDCYNPVAAATRLEAQRLLTRLSARSASSDGVVAELRKIARCLLCKRNHQNQATSVVNEWQQKIDDFVQSRVEPRDEETDDDDAASGGHTVDIREQMAECQRLLTRVATALESHQNAQRRFETFSVGSDTSTGTIRAHSSVASGTSRSESTQGDTEAEHTPEPLATELNLDHVNALVRRLTLEHEANRLRRSRTVRFEDDESHDEGVVSPASSTVSSQTLLPGEPDPEPQVSEHEHRVEGQMEFPATPLEVDGQIEFPTIPSEAEGRNNSFNGHSGYETRTAMTTGVMETEDDQSDNVNDPLTYTNLSPWSSGLHRASSIMFGNDGCNGAGDEVWCSRPSQSSRRYANPMWLAAVVVYLGVLFAWYRLQVLQTSGPRRLTLDGPVTHQIGTMAGQTDMRGPVLSSLALV